MIEVARVWVAIIDATSLLFFAVVLGAVGEMLVIVSYGNVIVPAFCEKKEGLEVNCERYRGAGAVTVGSSNGETQEENL